MAEVLTAVEKLRRSMEASTINVKKAFIFAVGWWLKKTHGFKKHPDAYKAAKDNIGMKSLVFNVPRWPKRIDDGPLRRQLQMFYQLMEQSLSNDEHRIDHLASQLALMKSWYYHKFVDLVVCHDLWWDCATDLAQCKPMTYSYSSRALAKKVFDDELFEAAEYHILGDSLEDSGHDFELDHLRTGKHTPACPILRKIAGIK